MATKKLIAIQQVTNKPAQSTIINNPSTGLPLFGMYPAIALPEVTFSGGPIYLRYGKHIGPNRGWGLEHIWKARFPNEPDYLTATPKVADLITSILVQGASIHYEYGLGSGAQRSSVFRNSTGVVIVEERQGGRNEIFYSIVTAIPCKNVNGPKIGAI